MHNEIRELLVDAIRRRQTELRHLRRLRAVVERMNTDGVDVETIIQHLLAQAQAAGVSLTTGDKLADRPSKGVGDAE